MVRSVTNEVDYNPSVRIIDLKVVRMAEIIFSNLVVVIDV